jgi:type IV pilus assembly protein PilC
MIAAGEQSRGRAEILERLASFLERDALLRKRLKASLTYPFAAIIVSIAMALFIVTWIVPTFARFYTDYHVEMPTIMLAAVAVAGAVKNPLTWLVGAGIFAGAGFLLNRYIATDAGALRLDRISQADVLFFGINFWPFGEIRRKTIASRVARGLAALLKSGVDMDKTLETIIPVAESPIVGGALQRVRETLRTGEANTLSEALDQHKALDSYLVGFLEIGEETGQGPEMLSRVSDYYDDDVEMNLQTLPEKILIVVIFFLGLVVFFLAYMVYVPLSSLTTGIH